MLGKRERPMQRTTSMSQLGGGSRYAERSHKVVAAPTVHDPINCNFLNPGVVPQPLQQEQHIQVNKAIASNVEHAMKAEGSTQHASVVHDEMFAQQGASMQSESLQNMRYAQDAPVQIQQDPEPFQPLDDNEKGAHLTRRPNDVLMPLPATDEAPRSFLDSCFLCKRRLRSGRDIFMYRGDIAFCSEECRQFQMINDERWEKFSISASRKGDISSSITVSKPNNEKVGTIAAA